MIILVILIIYILLGATCLFINRKYFINVIENDRMFRQKRWIIIFLVESILLWVLMIKLTYKNIRNYLLRRKLKRLKEIN